MDYLSFLDIEKYGVLRWGRCGGGRRDKISIILLLQFSYLHYKYFTSFQSIQRCYNFYEYYLKQTLVLFLRMEVLPCVV